MELNLRLAEQGDLEALLRLYTHLHGNPMPDDMAAAEAIWREIRGDRNHNIILGACGGRLVVSCVLVVVPNLTRGLRPYALIENVITHPDYRRRGFASAALDFAVSIAEGRGCYKIMLLTGSKEGGTLRFYERAGFNCRDKTAFIRWL